MAKMRFTILGCGSSPGVPRIGDDWGKCDPTNPKNRRRRAALLIERITDHGKTTVIVDTGPDFRAQMLDAGVGTADAVIFTHAHADHIHGIDDLRSFVINSRERVNIWADEPTSERLHEAFGYCFETPKGSNYPPILIENRIVPGEPFQIDGEGGSIIILPYEQDHGSIISLGFRIGSLAYSSDVSAWDDRALPHLNELEVLIIDALQYREHPSHFSLDQALGWIDKLKPKRAVLTHMHTPLDYQSVKDATPNHVEPAFDGMVITLDD
ncbi:MBL fold metallo-hydrolase [Pseudahrensia aquimaris]|uniref:MBL fold metallo-hydrolase n=1 Tax=Pseudahrensia aquimaris TaxID=744461 RepID=A0ABW3FJL5_9HYPH